MGYFESFGRRRLFEFLVNFNLWPTVNSKTVIYIFLMFLYDIYLNFHNWF